jgi:hypothetical protein
MYPHRTVKGMNRLMDAKVEQRRFMTFPSSEGQVEDAIKIHSRLRQTFQEDVRVSWTSMNCMNFDGHRAGQPRLDHIDSRRLPLFQEFQSVDMLAQELGVSLSPVYHRMTDVVGFSLGQTRWVPHFLIEELTAARVMASIEMLQVLTKQGLANFAGTNTGDESSLLLDYSGNHIRRLGEESTPERF